MAIDKFLINAFRKSRQIRDDVARSFERSGFEVTWIVDSRITDREDVWGYYLKLNRPLQSLFGTAREVLVWVAEPNPFIAKTVMQAQVELERARPRLCEDFTLIISPDPDAHRKVEEVAANLATGHVGIALDELIQLGAAKGALVRTIQTRLFAKDLYYISTAITSSHAFYGRRDLVGDILSDLKNATANVGLFGLRKMGKTSLLLRLADQLRVTTNLCWAHVDVQRVDAIQPGPAALLWSIAERLWDTSVTARKVQGYRLFGRFVSPYDLPDVDRVFADFDHDIRRLLKHSDELRLVIMLDEVELMTAERWGGGFVRFWRLMRAIAQESAGRISYFITGTNPRCIEVNRLGADENPAYNYFKTRYLGPLDRADACDLLKKLGQPMGLVWQPEALERVYGLVGGHPFLLRVFGSVVHRARLPRTQEVVVSQAVVSDSIDAFLREMSSTLSQMVEVLEEEYPNEYEILKALAEGRVSYFRELAEAFPGDTAHLQGYGLIKDPAEATALEVSMLQSWLQQRWRSRDTLRAASSEGYGPGDSIEGYVVEACIGHRGGMGDVYKCKGMRAGGNDVVAVKVLKHASMAALEREVGILKAIQHDNVVRFLDHGKTVRGELFIVMEYLDGRSLRHFCERARRLPVDDARAVCVGLAAALAAMHPNAKRMKELRSQGNLTPDEFEELQGARMGYVHRDIKPENVILVDGRGPVLIDFGIGCRVGTPVKTMSATMGYLPPDGVVGRWDQDTDLFQLGLTMLQVMGGVAYTGDNMDDLRDICRGEATGTLAEVVLRATEAERARRFGDVFELQNTL